MLIGVTDAQYKKLAPNRTQLYSMQVSCIRNFQTQLTNQTAQFWSRASVQSYWYKVLERRILLMADI